MEKSGRGWGRRRAGGKRRGMNEEGRGEKRRRGMKEEEIKGQGEKSNKK